MKKLSILFIVLLALPLAFAIDECGKVISPADVPCQITSLYNYTSPCSNWVAHIYNATGEKVEDIAYGNYGTTGLCNTTWNISMLGSYSYQVDNGDSGNILVQGDKKMMNFTVIIFLLAMNAGIFLLPVFIKSFANHQATDYVLRNLVFMLGILFLWLNVTILNQLAHDAGLGIDYQLSFFWWFMTCLVVIVIFAMVFVTTLGGMRMLKESEMRKRMGEDG